MSSDLREINLAQLIRAIVKATIAEAPARARTPKTLSGTVEDLSEDLDELYVHVDQEAIGSDPTVSDNYEFPGVLPAIRLGETFIDEQVRLDFLGAAGATAMRTSIESRIVLPYGASAGGRIVLEGLDGVITAGDVDTPGERVQIDGTGGVRFRNENDVLASALDHSGYQIRNPGSGLVATEVRRDRISLVNEATGEDIVVSADSSTTLPKPKYGGLPEVDPGTTIVAPAVTGFTSKDIEILHAAAWHPSSSVVSTWTPPASATERLDAGDNGQLAVSVADRRNPATGGSGTFTSSRSTWQLGFGTHVNVLGRSGFEPTFRSISEARVGPTTATQITASLSKPTGVVEGDVLVAFVSMGNAGGSVPLGWVTPEGWEFLGANFVSVGGGSTQSTLAVGAWAKLATASEPDEYEVTIDFAGGTKLLHSTIVAVQDASLIPGGSKITIDGHPVMRLLAQRETPGGSGLLADFQNIPPGYKNLRVVFDAHTEDNTGSDQPLRLRMNNDTGNNYHFQRSVDGSQEQALSTSDIRVSEVDGATIGRPTAGIIDILNYEATGHGRVALFKTFSITTANVRNIEGVGSWNNTTDAVNRVSLVATPEFAAGGKVWLYGY